MMIMFQVWFWKWRFMQAASRLRELEALPSAGYRLSGAMFAYANRDVRDVCDAMKAKALDRMEHAAGRLVALASARIKSRQAKVIA